MTRLPGVACFLALLPAALVACGGDTTETNGPPPLTQSELEDPAKCATCHPDQVREWSGSMHAYAADDPVFRAMNARGQRETKGALGSFCVKCHAPMALRDGATKDGTNLDQVDAKLKGVTCFFCHSVTAVKGTHDAPLELATDGVLRASIQDPVKTTAHAATYEPLLDRTQIGSASMCGSCHDIVTGAGAHIERTFEEWKGTVFSHGEVALACGECHMNGREGFAAHAPGTFERKIHDHEMAAVDVALTDFPEKPAQREAVQGALDTTLQSALCVKDAGGLYTVQLVLDNVGAGHAWPSGAAQDRRAWVELEATSKGAVVYQSGVVPKGESVTEIDDPDRWILRTCMFDAKKQPVDMFWQAVTTGSDQLPGPVTVDMTDPAFYATHVVQSWPRDGEQPIATPFDEVKATLHLVPVGLDVLDDLVKSGDLDPKVKDAMPEYTLAGATLTWTKKSATIQYLDQSFPVTCVAIGLSTGANNGNAAGKPACE
ncbi:MAG TPA: multiheme c-type cytochrome [Minicystis sp.]|nr:multiheme c-type cytochrome [Minicystis sp.]